MGSLSLDESDANTKAIVCMCPDNGVDIELWQSKYFDKVSWSNEIAHSDGWNQLVNKRDEINPKSI